MALGEGKIQLVDLLGLAQMFNQRKQDEPTNYIDEMLERKRRALELKKAEQEFALSKDRPLMTVYSDEQHGTGTKKIFLDEGVGYISGVSPEQAFQTKGENLRSMMAAMASSAGAVSEGNAQINAQRLANEANAPLVQEQAGLAKAEAEGKYGYGGQQLAKELAMIEAMGRGAGLERSEFNQGYRDLIDQARMEESNFKERMARNRSRIGESKEMAKSQRSTQDKFDRELQAKIEKSLALSERREFESILVAARQVNPNVDPRALLERYIQNRANRAK